MNPRYRIVIVVLSAVAVGFLLGFGTSLQLTAAPTTSLADAFRRLQPGLSSSQLDNLETIWKSIHRDYVAPEVDDHKLMDGVLAGLVAGLGDPYSTYFTPAEAKDFQNELDGTFDGIGVGSDCCADVY